MSETCQTCCFPLSPEERLKYRDRCRWCGAPEWRLDCEWTALSSLARLQQAQQYADVGRSAA